MNNHTNMYQYLNYHHWSCEPFRNVCVITISSPYFAGMSESTVGAEMSEEQGEDSSQHSSSQFPPLNEDSCSSMDLDIFGKVSTLHC